VADLLELVKFCYILLTYHMKNQNSFYVVPELLFSGNNMAELRRQAVYVCHFLY